MTAEVIVMNKRGVAIAADSATTATVGSRAVKIYRSTNKIELLSNNPPLALVHYGTATYNNIPWPLVIQKFKETYTKPWKSIGQCSRTFLSFLAKQPIDEKACQREYISQTIQSIFDFFGKMKESDLKIFLDCELQSILGRPCFIGLQDDFPDFSDETLKTIKELLSANMATANSAMKKNESQIRNLAMHALKHPCRFSSRFPTGIAIVGYGTMDYYPSMKHYHILGNLDNNLVYRFSGERKISSKAPNAVVPLAQTDEMESFFLGMNPDLKHEMQEALYSCLENFTETLKSKIKTYVKQFAFPETDLHDDIANEIISLKNKYERRTNQLQVQYKDNVAKTVRNMNLPDLAQFAKSLIDMTSLKRYVQQDDPGTVGGETEVAVLAKTDGFVWFKHKNTIDQDINQEFFKNVEW